ncbi:MAG: peptide chain release factor 1 [Erysipelotrichaceae bacterium]|nr:peptide chain release factor 1 [Erysipelotrichaceae bacterium]
MDAGLRKRLETTAARLQAIDEQLADPHVTDDMNNFREITIERASIADVVEQYETYLKIEQDKEDAFLMMKDDDEDIAAFARDEYKRLQDEESALIEEIKIALIPKDPNDDKNIVVEIRGAVGGDEANIFAGDLFRMYTRYAEMKGWRIEILDENPSDSGGYSMISFMIKGQGAYSRLKFESGAHRVQRVPKTEASGRIHTSTATVLVLPEVEDIEVEIRDEDLQIDTFRASGAGGQHVNKVESAIRITHLPTGIVASSQVEKSQTQNRKIAMTMLRSKIFAAKQAEQDEKIGAERKLKLGTGERSEKIRTYNYPQNRVTDHRIGLTLQKLDRIIEGDLDEVIAALINFDQAEQIKGEL